MAKLKIITGENAPILRVECKAVKKFDASLKKFVKDMKDTMFAANGLGIAAPQVNKDMRVFLVTLDIKTKNERVVAMVNPVLSSLSKEKEMGEEGCLSLPGLYGQVSRHKKIEVEFFDVEGNRQMLALKGLNARVVQHENDHINGVLFIDRMKEDAENIVL
ncbi:peptide deformylase [Candidatus Peregrinibacteria bacterium CG10_big_fil_rev_8_21_14_0_10_36_19]|nr:MAG: peptide deformylase [Candidatus Peregrinibacteria bacterium CG10_big_fil_rev_8_21_14_0_10_36_19]